MTALFNESIPAPLGARLAEKMHQDGIPKNALKPINGKELTYEELMSYSLRYADGIIECEPGISEQVLAAAESLPKLQFIDDNDVNKVTEFYGSLFD